MPVTEGRESEPPPTPRTPTTTRLSAAQQKRRDRRRGFSYDRWRKQHPASGRRGQESREALRGLGARAGRSPSRGRSGAAPWPRRPWAPAPHGREAPNPRALRDCFLRPRVGRLRGVYWWVVGGGGRGGRGDAAEGRALRNSAVSAQDDGSASGDVHLFAMLLCRAFYVLWDCLEPEG